ncbi:MAG: leucyl aminopeptidase family protein [Proteobacteria bacterium]|nr:leucyl aminopeptidase family protein [Pseudomonadota bacterium]
MNQDWNTVEIKLADKPSEKIQAHYHLAIADFSSRMILMDLLADRVQAKETLSGELKKLKKDEDSVEPKTISIGFEGKGGLTAILMTGDASAYVKQTAIRKNFISTLSTGSESKEVVVSLRGLKDRDAAECLNWIVSLALISRYRSPVFGKKAGEQKPLGKLTVRIDTGISKKEAAAIIEEARILGFANNQVRHLAELPSNVLHPGTYRERAEQLARELKVKSRFLGKKELQKMGAGAFLAVAQGDHHDRAGIVHLHYSPGKKTSKKSVAIVGKGLCFDTGGYNVKTGDFMHGMHGDMTGSAVTLSLFQVLVQLKAPFEVHAYLALAENLISPDAYRPNDVVVASNGVSIEVENTDAEGRMVLSDTLVLASGTKPDLILDFATLTGSVVRSLDTRRAGAFSNDLELSGRAVKVGDRVGERVWNFPINEDYSEYVRSDYADVRQCSTKKAADHIYAATFLSRFVGKGTPWVHIDLACSENPGGLGLVPTESTGFGVRFGLEFIREVLG